MVKVLHQWHMNEIVPNRSYAIDEGLSPKRLALKRTFLALHDLLFFFIIFILVPRSTVNFCSSFIYVCFAFWGGLILWT